MPTNLIQGFRRWLHEGLRARTQSTSIILWILRGAFIATIIGSATYALLYFDSKDQFGLGLAIFAILLVLGLGIIVADIVVRNKQITTISAVYFGLLMGFLLGSLFWTALEPLVSYIFKRDFPELV